MKSLTSRLSSLSLLIACVMSAPGCMNQPLPKDAYIKGVHSKIVTPWGTSEQIIDEAATGTAARNASKAEPAPRATDPIK